MCTCGDKLVGALGRLVLSLDLAHRGGHGHHQHPHREPRPRRGSPTLMRSSGGDISVTAARADAYRWENALFTSSSEFQVTFIISRHNIAKHHIYRRNSTFLVFLITKEKLNVCYITKKTVLKKSLFAFKILIWRKLVCPYKTLLQKSLTVNNLI